MTANTARPPLLLGLDVGTQSLRAALIDAHGRTVSVGVAPIETTYPRPTWAEQQPIAWWSAAGDAVRLALAHDDIEPGQIAAIGLDCTACTVAGVRLRRPAPPPCSALDGSARIPRGRRDQCHWRSGLTLRVGSGLSRVDASQGTLAQAQRAPDLRAGRPDRRVHRLDDVSTDWRVDVVTESRGGQMELRATGRRLAGRALEGGRAGRSSSEVARADRPAGQGRGAPERTSGPRPGSPRGHSRRSGRDRRVPGNARPGGDAGRRRGRHRRLKHLPPRPVARGSLRLGGRRLLSRRDRAGALHPRGRPDRHRLDPRVVSAPLRRQPGARSRKARRQRLPGARRAGRGRAAGLGGAGRARRLAGQPISLQEPTSPRGDRGIVAGPRSRPHLAPFTKRPLAARATSWRTPRPMGSRSSGSFWEEAGPSPHCGSRFTPTSSRSPSGLPARARHVPSGRQWPPPWPPVSIPTSTRRPAQWSPSSGSLSPTRPMPRYTTSCSGGTSSCTAGSIVRLPLTRAAYIVCFHVKKSRTEGGSMARMPSLLRLLILLTTMACSGCALWHFRKDAKPDKTSSSSGSLQPVVQDLSNASLHGWNFNSRW